MPAPTIPPGINAAISWFENHLIDWATNQGTIGVTIQQVTDIGNATTAARNAFNASEQAHFDAKSSTVTLHTVVDTMRKTGGAFVKTVRAFADSSADPNVFVLANIPPPIPGSPLPPPAVPTSPTGVVNNNGQVEVSWKSSLTGRIFFRIERQVVPTGQPANQWELKGAMTGRKFVDTDVPANATSVLYRVAAMRNGQLSLFSDPVQVMLATPGAAVA